MSIINNLPKNVFFIVPNVKASMMTISISPLVVADDRIIIGKNKHSKGFLKLLTDKRFLSLTLTGNHDSRSGANEELYNKEYNGNIDAIVSNSEEIKFDSIKMVDTRKSFNDIFIDLVYIKEEEQRLTLAVADNYNTIPEETKRLAQLIKQKIRL